MQSDILIVFPTSQSKDALSKASACLMQTDHSVLVHRKEDSTRVLLVKYDPKALTPTQLLKAVHEAGFDATMAGG